MVTSQEPSAAPDWAVLYAKHRGAMHRVAAAELRSAGLADHANDVVQQAMASLMTSPPRSVRSWEGLLISTVKRRAWDLLGSAAVRHAGPELPADHGGRDEDCTAEVALAVLDRQRRIETVQQLLRVLDERHRKVAWDYLALDRPRKEVAAELGVSPARVSQMAKEALKTLKDEMQRRGESCEQ